MPAKIFLFYFYFCAIVYYILRKLKSAYGFYIHLKEIFKERCYLFGKISEKLHDRLKDAACFFHIQPEFREFSIDFLCLLLEFIHIQI